MTRTRSVLLLASLLALVSPALSRAETVEDHAGKPVKTVALTPTRISPQDLTMGTGDVLAFQNFSTQQMMQLTFIQPKNVGQYTTCQQLKRVSPTSAVAPGALFQREDDQVTALIAPGTFVSVCSLKPGVYVYTATTFGGVNQGEQLGLKGTITVK